MTSAKAQSIYSEQTIWLSMAMSNYRRSSTSTTGATLLRTSRVSRSTWLLPTHKSDFGGLVESNVSWCRYDRTSMRCNSFATARRKFLRVRTILAFATSPWSSTSQQCPLRDRCSQDSYGARSGCSLVNGARVGQREDGQEAVDSMAMYSTRTGTFDGARLFEGLCNEGSVADIRGHNPNLRDISVSCRGVVPNSRGKSAQGDG